GGGGLTTWATSGATTVVNSTISGNTATSGSGYGGGICQGAGTAITIINSTITNNTSAGAPGGGGIRNKSATSTVLTNSIVAGNFDTSGSNSPDFSGSVTANFSLIGKNGGAVIAGA